MEALGGNFLRKKAGKKRKKVGKAISLVMKMVVLLGFIVLTVLGVLFYKKYGKRILKMEEDAKRIVKMSSPDTFRQTETGIIYDADGGILSRLKGEKDVYYIEYGDIPQEAINAIVSIEDKKYFKHKGYDGFAILRAGLAYVKNKGVITQGGSTITQQLARNIFLSFEESLERKAKEIFISIELEKKYTKQELMEFYLNNIYFANGYYGIQSASYGYFGKSVTSLSLSQIAFLLSIPNSPNRYDPYENMEGTLGRRDRILGQMFQDGKITEGELKKAKEEKIKVKARKKGKSSYAETFALDQAVKSLMKANGFVFWYDFPNKEVKNSYYEDYAKEYAEYQRALYSGGYRIYTSIEPEKQKILQEKLDEHLKVSEEKSEEGIYKLQGAAVTIDNETGRVVAIVGGRSQNLQGRTLNRAYQSKRQPGSTIKPLVVYTPAFEKEYRPESIVKDEKIEKGPKNADGIFSGDMTILDAVAVSKNTVAWRLFAEISPAKGLEKLLQMQFSSIEESDYYPATALGGMTKGVSALEITSAYATLENGGKFRTPSCIVKVTDALGVDIIPSGFQNGEEEKEVYGEEATKMMITCMDAVMKKGTGRKGKLSNMQAVGKTGTTNDAKDLWFAGFTKYYTTGIWVGYDLPKSLNSLPYRANPLMIWKDYMDVIHQGKKTQKLEMYELPKKVEKVEEISEEEAEEENIPKEENNGIEEMLEEKMEENEEEKAENEFLEETEGENPEEGEEVEAEIEEEKIEEKTEEKEEERIEEEKR